MSNNKDAIAVLETSLARLQQGRQEKFTNIFKHNLKYFFRPIFHFFRCIFLTYPIEDQISSSATRVIFTHSKYNKQSICLKLWQRCKNGVYDTQDVSKCANYVVDGFRFNRQFAQKVYLGIASVEISGNRFRRGWLIRKPDKSKLKPGADYALIMRRLDETWRLDHQLSQGELGTKVGIEFLAREIAHMHKRLSLSRDVDMGKPDSIPSKLALNRSLFDEALNKLYKNVGKYRSIGKLMEQAYKEYTKHFEHRYQDNHIKRCHGDLKATNLWVRPAHSQFFGLVQYSQQLLALDCVDFNPEFCHIDTLSDVAMLAIDIEVRLTNWRDKGSNKQSEKRPFEHFLDTYLEEVEENGDAVRPLLEYYMTEKAMICAYMNILYGSLPTLGRKYLDVALNHAQRLEKLLVSPGKLPASKKKITSSLALSHSK